MRVRYALVIERDTVPVAKVEKHLATPDEALEIASYELRQGPAVNAPNFYSAGRGLLFLLAPGGFGLLILYAC